MDIIQEDYKIIEIDYRIPKGIQGEFKTLSFEEEQKLVQSYKTMKIFRPPLTVWRSSENSKEVFYLVDGHQSQKVFKKHNAKINGGYIIKALEIVASSLDEAKEKLLIFNSEYGEKNMQGFWKFTEGMDLDKIKLTTSFKIEQMTMPKMVMDFQQRKVQEDRAKNIFIPATPNAPEPNTTLDVNTPNVDNNSTLPTLGVSGGQNPDNALGQPLIPSIIPVSIIPIVTKADQKKTQTGRPTDDEHTMFSRIMKMDDYRELIGILNHIRTNKLLPPNNDLSDALMFMVNEYKVKEGLNNNPQKNSEEDKTDKS